MIDAGTVDKNPENMEEANDSNVVVVERTLPALTES